MIKIRLAYGATDVEFYAICLTGPEFFRHVLCSFEFTNVDILPLRCEQYKMTSPLENQKTWAQIRITRTYDKADTLKRTVDAIKFELEHFSILRLDDHITNMHKSFYGDEEILDVELIGMLLDALKQIDLIKAETVQCLFKYQETLDFYSRNSALSSKVTVFTTNESKIRAVFDHIVQYDKFRELCSMLKKNTNDIEIKELEQVVSSIETCVIFLKGFRNRHNGLPKWLVAYCKTFFQDLVMYIDRINSNMEASNQLDKQEIFDLLKSIGLQDLIDRHQDEDYYVGISNTFN